MKQFKNEGNVNWDASKNKLNYQLYWVCGLLVTSPLRVEAPLKMTILASQSFRPEHILWSILEKVNLLFYAVKHRCIWFTNVDERTNIFFDVEEWFQKFKNKYHVLPYQDKIYDLFIIYP